MLYPLFPKMLDFKPDDNYVSPRAQERREQTQIKFIVLATKANRKSHMANKEQYDRRTKHRSFNVGDYVYLYDPAQKPGLSKKFHFYWTCPYQTTGKLSDLNYEVKGAAAKT
jgi:hypothetical protein